MMALEKTTFVGFNNDVLKHDSYKKIVDVYGQTYTHQVGITDK